MDITYDTRLGILSVAPDGALEKEEFDDLSSELAAIRKDDRTLNGVLIHTRDFPGYEKFSDLIAHKDFVEEHGSEIPKVAICTDSAIGGLIVKLGRQLTDAEVMKFHFDDRDDAEKWILS